MKNVQVTLEQTTIKILFSQYRLFIIPILIIIACLILFLKIIIPQVDEYFSIEQETKVLVEKIGTLQENIRLLTTVDEDNQSQQVIIATKALPSEKDYAGIITAIATTAVRSGVLVDDFSFSVGNVTAEATDTSAPIRLSLNITGGMEGTRRLITELSQSLPLSDVEAVEVSGNRVTLSVLFYYKALPSMQIEYRVPILPLSKKEEELLQTLRLWNAEVLQLSPIVSGSAE